MARALSTGSSSPFKTLLSDAVSFLMQRRGFAAAAAAAADVLRRSPKAEDKAAAAPVAPHPHPWVPDPLTGCYRPANPAVQLDAADLRAMLLTPKP